MGLITCSPMHHFRARKWFFLEARCVITLAIAYTNSRVIGGDYDFVSWDPR